MTDQLTRAQTLHAEIQGRVKDAEFLRFAKVAQKGKGKGKTNMKRNSAPVLEKAT